MKKVYPVILSHGEEFIVAHVLDFGISTQGADVVEAIGMARDAIGAIGVDLEDDGESLPEPTEVSKVKTDSTEDIVTLVDVDFGVYHRMNDLREVERNCTIPSWLNFEAESAGVNFSEVLTAALKSELKIRGL